MCFFKKRKKKEEEAGMTKAQAINLLFHIANNIDRIAETEEDADVYIQAIEKAVSSLRGLD